MSEAEEVLLPWAQKERDIGFIMSRMDSFRRYGGKPDAEYRQPTRMAIVPIPFWEIITLVEDDIYAEESL